MEKPKRKKGLSVNATSDQATESRNHPEDSPTLSDESKTVAEQNAAAGAKFPLPEIPAHELIMRVGSGPYGEVWLARNVMGYYHAVKIIYRAAFEHARPFERESHGIKNFEPLSRSHEALMDFIRTGQCQAFLAASIEVG